MKKSYIEIILSEILNEIYIFKVPICSAFITATMTYMFILTNKIINWDDSQFLFGKGYTLTSGRWGLDILRYILPDYSMPWLWGVVSIILLTISICFIICIFEIKNKVLQCILAAVIIAFPSEIGTMFYMFTSSSYAIAFLVSVLGVYLFIQPYLWKKTMAIILTIFALSIYQAYIAISASFLVILLVQNLLEKKYVAKEVVLKGIEYVGFLIISLAIYYGITLIILRVSGQTFNAWATRATSDTNGLVYRCIRAWKLFAASILFKTYGLETTNLSRIAHIVMLSVTGMSYIILMLKHEKMVDFFLGIFLLMICLPLSVYFIVVIIGEDGVHALTLYSFIAVYIFAIIVIEEVPLDKMCLCVKDISIVCFALIIISNIFIANKEYLKQYLVYENTYSFYETILTQIQMTPEFSEDCKLAVIGNVQTDSSYLDNFGEDVIYGLNGFKGEAISDDIIHQYLGFDIEFASEDEVERIEETDEFKNMMVYPYYGYVKKIDNYIVVKLGVEN